MSTKKTVKLSASRIKTADSCSWLYFCKYKLKLPEKGNDGASRGTVCHLILELISAKDRMSYYKKIIESRDIFSVPSVGRLALIWAKKLKVDDPENLELINFMTVNGLEYDYFGDSTAKPTESFSEKSFDIEIDDGDKSYRINGFIDKLFLYKGKKAAVIRDFKTSKAVFDGKEAVDNMQDLMYSLAVKHLYPNYSFRQSEFLFLKFDLSPDLLGKDGEGVLKMSPLSDDELEGFEYQLTAWQSYLEDFTESNAYDNFACDKGWVAKEEGFAGKLLCGFASAPGQLKKDGNPMWHCAFKFPFSYAVAKDSDGNIRKSAFIDDIDSLLPYEKEGCTIEEMDYSGCPRHNSVASSNPSEDAFDF